MPDAAGKYRDQLLAQAQKTYRQTPLSALTIKAYLDTPRHQFVQRYREWGSSEWHDVTEANLHEHLARLYADHPLTLVGDDDDSVLSTISQPSFVLRMLDLLQLDAGQRVFELGAGSGWNAALIGRLVGPSGEVYSTEILPEMAARAKRNVSAAGLTNVHIVAADGGAGFPAGAPYDRATFTAGAYDLPRHFYSQIKEGGLLLSVIKNAGGGDNLFILQKKDDRFESISSMPCGFVQMTGRYQEKALDPLTLESLPGWETLRSREVGRRPFWWGTKGAMNFSWQTLGVRSFLAITDPMFRAFKSDSSNQLSEQFFGLWDEAGGSLAIARNEELVSFGAPSASERLMRDLHRWIDAGMPTASSFRLSIFPIDAAPSVGPDSWLVRRTESQFLWTLAL